MCDLGCGVGSPAAPPLPAGGGAGPEVGIGLNPSAAASARQNLADNGLAEKITPEDLRDRTLLAGTGSRLVVSTRPYFRAGVGNSRGRRMDDTCSVTDLCQAAGRWPAPGAVCLVYRPERLAGCLPPLAAARLGKRMQLLA